MRLSLAWLDPWVLRRPFSGSGARRYAEVRGAAFGDLDERLLARLGPELGAARVFLDVGAGTGVFAALVARRHPGVRVVAVEPSADLGGPAITLRARAEQLPLAAASVDVAMCLSSLRHVQDRAGALAELRRVLRPGGVAYVVELDPAADRARTHRHVRAMRGRWARLTFDPFVLRTCPPAPHFQAAAVRAGFASASWAADPEQPFWVMRLA